MWTAKSRMNRILTTLLPPQGATSRVQIGTWAGEAWPGMVDEVRLWNRALSDDEMEQSMEMGG